MTDLPLAFSLALLANAADAEKPLTSCSRGHLRVAHRTCWRPVSYSAELATLLHEPVDDCEG